MNTLIGNSDQSLRNRAHARVRNTNYVDSVQSINNHFSDNGLFGISVTGAGSHSQELLSVALEELSNLRNTVSDAELARAKNSTKMNVLLTLENQANRLEEIANNFFTYGDLTFHQYAE